MPVDLHLHSNASDGIFNPSKIVHLAINYGLSAISITDHDTIDGIEEALKASNKIDIVPGVEMSCLYGEKDFHIIGYFVDYKSEELIASLNKFNEIRHSRAEKMAKLLQEQGHPVTIEEILEESKPAAPGRAHIARLLIKKGIVKNMSEAFNRYLKRGASCYIPKTGASCQECIQIIKNTGGLASIAHPGASEVTEEDILMLKNYGLDAIEVFHPNHSRKTTKNLLKLSEKIDLLVTGGSDSHGSDAHCPPLSFASISDEYYLKLKETL